MPTVRREKTVNAPLEQTFAYFSDPRNLPAITPPSMRFTIDRMPADRISAGTEIDYTIRIARIPVRCES